MISVFNCLLTDLNSLFILTNRNSVCKTVFPINISMVSPWKLLPPCGLQQFGTQPSGTKTSHLLFLKTILLSICDSNLTTQVN